VYTPHTFGQKGLGPKGKLSNTLRYREVQD
jgi:hypothetical protein